MRLGMHSPRRIPAAGWSSSDNFVKGEGICFDVAKDRNRGAMWSVEP